MNLELLTNQDKIGNSKNSSLTMRLLFNKPNERPTFEEITSIFTPKLEKKASFDNAITKSTNQLKLRTDDIKKAKSMMNDKEDLGVDSSPKGGLELNNQTREGEKKFTELVLKRRNFAIFLLELAEVCFTLEDDESRSGLLIGYIFFKKSTLVITGLLGYLRSEAGYEDEVEADFSAA